MWRILTKELTPEREKKLKKKKHVWSAEGPKAEWT